MENTLYLECYSGISGDMTVAALLDLGADAEVLQKVLKSIPIAGFKTKISRVKKAGVDACDFAVISDKEHENHDHDMEYLHGGPAEQHGHVHSCADYGHTHEHRGLKEILHIIEHSAATERAKATAEKIFRILAEAEAEAHGVPPEEVHFHEVGAVDSIVDILSAAVCLDNLGIEQVIVSELYEGRGCIRCQHGVIPIPVPAVVNIVKRHEICLHQTAVEGELVTPTGAAIAAAVMTSKELPKRYYIKKAGLGAGKRTYDCPGILRAMLIEEPQKVCEETKDAIYQLQTNIDDCSGEQLGMVMEQLFEVGAKDVYYVPVFMKKNRPAYQLNVICAEKMAARMEEILFLGTTTIGIRRMKMERTILIREKRKVETRFGEADAKICTLPNGKTRCYPEYQSIAELAKIHGKDYREIYLEIQRCAEKILNS